MSKRPAFVLTQAMSSGYFFPLWYSYYAREIGSENIYVLTQSSARSEFEAFELGGVFTYASDVFDDGPRSELISAFARGLLQLYDAAIVVDADEILVPDPRQHGGLLAYLEDRSELYSTSIGIDLIEDTNEGELDTGAPVIVSQRKFGYLTSSLCKTSLTRVPLNWGVGFHYCSVYPSFNGTFLFHLKRSDRAMQLAWLQHMSTMNIAKKETRDYYAPEVEKIENFYNVVRRWERREGWDAFPSETFVDDYTSAVRLDRSGIYRGKHFNAGTICRIPEEFLGRF